MTKTEILKTLTGETGKALCNAIDDLDKDGVRYFLSEGGRTLLAQCLYALQGRLGKIPATDLEWACQQAGIRPPGSGVITETLKSNHLNGNAVDIMPMVEVKTIDANGCEKAELRVDWKNQDGRIVAAMKKAGFIWGGDWANFPDPPHFEYKA